MLPRYGTKPDKTVQAADWGTLVHYWKETGLTDPRWATDRDVACLDRKLAASGVRRADWWAPGEGEHEVSFALQLFTLELQLFHGPRSAAEKWKAKWNGRKYLTGTIDWLHWGDGETIAWVDDLKTGHWPVDPSTSKQLRSYLLVAWVRAGCPGNWEGAVSITQWEKYPLWGAPKRKGCRLSALDMAEHLADLKYAAEHPEEANPEAIYVGPWDPDIPLSPCAFCPCRPQFPVGEWLTNYRYRAAPHCVPGMLYRIRSANGE